MHTGRSKNGGLSHHAPFDFGLLCSLARSWKHARLYSYAMLSTDTNYDSGNALTDNFFADMGIKQDQFNVSQQSLSLSIIILKVRHQANPVDFKY